MGRISEILLLPPHLDTEQCPLHSHCLVTSIITYCVYILKPVLFGNEEVIVEGKRSDGDNSCYGVAHYVYITRLYLKVNI